MTGDLEALSLTSGCWEFPLTSFDQLQKHGSAQSGKIGNEKLLYFSSVDFLITVKQTANVYSTKFRVQLNLFQGTPSGPRQVSSE